MRGIIFSVLSLTFVGGLAKAAMSGETYFGLSHYNFVSSGEPYFGGQFKEDNMSTVQVDFDFQDTKVGQKSRLDASLMQSFVEGETYFNLRELYYDSGSIDDEVVLGRKKYLWSEADELWKTGLWQPQFRWHRLRPESQGLVGGFWRHRLNKKEHVLIMISPFFIPDEGVRFQEKNNRLESANPWFRSPPQEAPLYGENTELYHKVEVPSVSDVLANPGLGFRWERQSTRKQGFGLAYAYKPINQIMNAFNYQLRAATVDGGVDLTFYPYVAYHHLATVDWRYQDRKYGHLLSYTYESPDRLLKEEAYNYQVLKKSHVLSWMSFWNIAGEGPSATRLYGGYLRYWGGSSPDGGDTVGEGSQFELRPRFVSVGKVGFRYPIWSKSRRLINGFEANYDVLMKGGTLLSQLEYLASDSFVVGLNMDLIGVTGRVPGAFKNSFVNSYRANDVASLKVSYVF